MTGKELILQRRSIREFTDEYVSDKELYELLEAARFAPSWANTQSPYFIVIRNREVIRELAEKCYPNNRGAKASIQASLVLVACYEKGKAGYYRGMDFNMVGTWSMFDLGAACQNISLRCHEMGLGSVIIGAYDYANAKDIISLEDKYEIGAIIPIGKRAQEVEVPKRREMAEMYRTIE